MEHSWSTLGTILPRNTHEMSVRSVHTYIFVYGYSFASCGTSVRRLSVVPDAPVPSRRLAETKWTTRTTSGMEGDGGRPRLDGPPACTDGAALAVCTAAMRMIIITVRTLRGDGLVCMGTTRMSMIDRGEVELAVGLAVYTGTLSFLILSLYSFHSFCSTINIFSFKHYTMKITRVISK